jgi:hypothetical protein
MAQTFLIFEFGTNEELAQQARHRVEGWKQGFRLGKKLELKFERAAAEDQKTEKDQTKKYAGKAPSKNEEENSGERVRLIIRLDFSDHEKLSLQRWLDRIPTEEPFKSVKSQIIRAGEKDFEKTAELFEMERNYSKR